MSKQKKSLGGIVRDTYSQAGNVLDPNNKNIAAGFFSSGNLVKPFKKCGCK